MPALVNNLCNKISEKIKVEINLQEQFELSFNAHFDLVAIHPFYDGNGRTSRLLMNFIQHFYELPLTIVYKEDKAEYFQALQDTREKEDISIFRNFMYRQTAKYLQEEINKFKSAANQGKGKRGGYSLIF